MARQLLRRLAIGVLAGLLVACSDGAPSSLAMANAPRAAADPADAALAAAAINDFGLELLGAAASGSDNAVVSPASVAIALARARAGARGATAAQMDRVLRDVASDDHAGWLNALDAALATRSGRFEDRGRVEREVVLRIANAPFAQRDYPWEPDFLTALASRFGAGVRLVDYVTDFEAARRAINAWVGERTEGRIPELLEAGTVDPMTVMVLVNAIYLKAAWLTPFEDRNTAPGPFTRLDGSTVDVTTMHGVVEGRYAAGDGWRAVELPYVGGSLAMTVIVPDDLAAFAAALDGERFASIAGAFENREVDLWLPKFGLETKADLKDVLEALGMPDAFDPGRADFSGMTTADILFITAVIHQANIDVDEKGSEAAAAAAVVMGRTSVPERVTLKVDRPFLFALRDVPTGAILFLGRVVEPAERT